MRESGIPTSRPAVSQVTRQLTVKGADDKPRVVTQHWAIDRFLIAPCPHKKLRAGIWRVGPTLDSRIDGQKDLVALHGQRVIAPIEEKFSPAIESLRWREQHLTAKYSPP